MFDLIMGYLLIFILMLGANINLILNEYNTSKIKLIVFSSILSILTFVCLVFSSNFYNALFFLNDNFGWLFIIIAIILFVVDIIYLKYKSSKYLPYGISIILLILVFTLSSQIVNLSLVDCLLLTLFLFVILIILYPVSSLLHYAKRDYSVIVGEFFSTEIVLFLLIGATFWSVKNLDYTMFSSFLILTPTYQLVYVIIGLFVILLIGLYYNDKQLKKR